MHARRTHCAIVWMSAAGLSVAVAGCFGLVPEGTQSDTKKSEPSPAKQATRPDPQQQHQPQQGDREPPAGQPVAGQPRTGNPPQLNRPAQAHVAPRPAFGPTVQTTPAISQYIQLSAGAVLPVSLPQGTVMSFSAEYRFVGSPKDGVRYVFVVQGRGGKTVRALLVNLKSSGQLPGLFTPALRPEDKPFQGFIEEWPASTGRVRPGDGKRVSNIVPLS